MKKAIIWILIVLLLLGGGATLYYLFSIGAIGFELPATNEPVRGDLVALFTEPATEPPATEPEPTEPVATEPAPTEPAPTEPTDPADPSAPTEPESGEEEKPPREITAADYFVYDMREREFLELTCHETAKIYPASITKLMSCYTALQHWQPDDVLTVGTEISLINWDSSRAYLQQGDTLTVEQCIQAMLLPSGNDAAYTLAANTGRKVTGKKGLSDEAAIDAFVKEMNRVAQEIGMDNSHFVTCDGMHLAQHYTCARDLTILIHEILKTPAILDSAAMLSATADLGSHTRTWKNTNLLLNPKSTYYVPYAMGLKTGYTSYAGNCLLSLFFDDDRLYLVGTFNSPNYYGRFADNKQLYESIFEEN